MFLRVAWLAGHHRVGRKSLNIDIDTSQFLNEQIFRDIQHVSQPLHLNSLK